jgi:hypothetical protein
LRACHCLSRRACKEAYQHVFEAFFSAIRDLTGKDVSCTLWDKKANFSRWAVDGDVAQLKSLGRAMQTQMKKFFKVGDEVSPELCDIMNNPDPVPMVLNCVQGCQVHNGRSVVQILFTRIYFNIIGILIMERNTHVASTSGWCSLRTLILIDSWT